MARTSQESLLSALTLWLQGIHSVRAVVLFGSQVRKQGEPAAADTWSDVDLHIITSRASQIELTNWSEALPNYHFCLQVIRPATGGVKKITVLFDEGEADLVILPVARLQLTSILMSLGLHQKLVSLRYALNSLSTIMGGGYKFLKGEDKWGAFYAKVVVEMPGYRINDPEVEYLARAFLCDLLWVLQKIERGELIAAQRVVHRSLIETNILLLHELRNRQKQTTYQQARRLEQLVSSKELQTVQISARLERQELRLAAWSSLMGLRHLMKELRPDWTVPSAMHALLVPYSISEKK